MQQVLPNCDINKAPGLFAILRRGFVFVRTMNHREFGAVRLCQCDRVTERLVRLGRKIDGAEYVPEVYSVIDAHCLLRELNSICLGAMFVPPTGDAFFVMFCDYHHAMGENPIAYWV